MAQRIPKAITRAARPNQTAKAFFLILANSRTAQPSNANYVPTHLKETSLGLIVLKNVQHAVIALDFFLTQIIVKITAQKVLKVALKNATMEKKYA